MRTGASNDTVTTLVADWQGTIHHQINNATGALSTSWQDPYGNPRGTPPTAWTGERGFVGGTRDATGLTRVGARDYDPVLQRFITVDYNKVAIGLSALGAAPGAVACAATGFVACVTALAEGEVAAASGGSVLGVGGLVAGGTRLPGQGAKAGANLVPKVDRAFQFPGAGRSGAGMKNFVGPRTQSHAGQALGGSLSPTSTAG